MGERPWCSHKKLYKSGEWDWCFKKVENENPTWTHEECEFPFVYGHNLYNGCTKAGNENYPWCYDAKKKAIWCIGEGEIENQNWMPHEKCEFPFVYDYKRYYGCTKAGNENYSWCSYNKLYKKGEWDWCYE